MSKMNVKLARLGVFAPVVLRVVGSIMAYHGFKKFQGGLGGVEGFFRMVDAPGPALPPPLVAGVGLIGGVALIAGLATRLIARALGGGLIAAVVLVKVDLGLIAPPGPMPGTELDLALLAGLGGGGATRTGPLCPRPADRRRTETGRRGPPGAGRLNRSPRSPASRRASRGKNARDHRCGTSGEEPLR